MMDCKLYVTPPDTPQCACRAEQRLGSNKKPPTTKHKNPPKPTQINNKTHRNYRKSVIIKLKYVSLITVINIFMYKRQYQH